MGRNGGCNTHLLDVALDDEPKPLTGEALAAVVEAVSYTHLKLPTIYPVEISVVAGQLKKKKKNHS